MHEARMRRRGDERFRLDSHLLVIAVASAALSFGACGSGEQTTTLTFSGGGIPSAYGPEGQAPPPPSGAQPDAAVTPTADAMTATDTGTPNSDVTEPDAGPIRPPTDPSHLNGETDGDGVIFLPEALEGVLVYGVGAEQGSALTQVGNTAAGMIAVPAIVDLEPGAEPSAGQMHIRIVDSETLAPVEGADGIVETYAYSVLEDGRVRVDFAQPLKGLEVHLWQSCTYGVTGYELDGAPRYEDGLLTWPAAEHFEPSGCGGGVGSSLGVHVHFLRRADVTADFEPRLMDPESPFGFFLSPIPGGDGTWLARLPHISPSSGDGQLEYMLSHDFPAWLVPGAEAVIESWNVALEEAVGVRPFALVDPPADMLAWDPRYRVIDFDGSSSGGAVAPFIEHPLTGEIFESDVILWLGGLEQMLGEYGAWLAANPQIDTGPIGMATGGTKAALEGGLDAQHFELDESSVAVLLTPPIDLPARVLRRRAFHRRHVEPRQLAMQVAQFAKDLSDEEVGQLVMADFLVHELGHNLGLRHNFKASLDRAQHGDSVTATSVMDYVFGMFVPGPYDVDAMRYAYGDGASNQAYAYCTDEDIFFDPGCTRWDFGDPVQFALDRLDAIAQEYGLNTPDNEMQWYSQQGEWQDLFLQTRQFLNTDYELYDPELPNRAFDGLLQRVVCGADCGYHTWLRSQLALYLLYTRHSVQGDWYDLPALDAVQAETLMTAYFELVTDAGQPFGLKETIVGKLPTAAVDGANALLAELATYFAELEDPSNEEQALAAAVADGLAQ